MGTRRSDQPCISFEYKNKTKNKNSDRRLMILSFANQEVRIQCNWDIFFRCGWKSVG